MGGSSGHVINHKPDPEEDPESDEGEDGSARETLRPSSARARATSFLSHHCERH